MSVSSVPELTSRPVLSRVPLQFVSKHDRTRKLAEWQSEGAMVVDVGVSARTRGALAEVIEQCIELRLDTLGAGGPGMGGLEDREALVADQLFRIRSLGFSHLVLAFGSLSIATTRSGAIDPDDLDALVFWAAEAKQRPISMVLDAEDSRLDAYLTAVPLGAALGVRLSRLVSDAALEIPRAVRPSPEPASDTSERDGAHVTPAPVAETTMAAPAPAQKPSRTRAWVEKEATGADETVASQANAAEGKTSAREEPARVRTTDEKEAVPQPDVVKVQRKTPTVDFRPWVHALSQVRGPQPLSSFERLYVDSYLPLSHAIARGLDDARALAAYEEFQETFAHAYTEASPTFGVTGRRPRSPLDAWDQAHRLARLLGARTTQLILVDAMRYDIGRVVRQMLALLLEGHASVTEESMLYSTLPTNTMRQLETIARGVDGLRDPARLDPEPRPPRGRVAEAVRRLRAGSRDLFKLDIVEASLEGAVDVQSLEPLAQRVAEILGQHISTMPARTLVYIFGDHGFRIDRDGHVHTGGASPEEVMVPAFALLTGELH